MTETQKNPLAESFNALSLIRFAFPSMVMMLFMGLYTIVDTIFVARFVDTNALSSINIVCPVINLIVGLGTMLATGGSAVVAKKMGNGNTEEARSNFTLIVVAGAVIGLLITAAGLFFLDEIIWGLGASEILFPYCRDYLTIQLIFAAFNMMQVLYQNLFVTAGKPTLGLVLAVLAGIANIVFDYVFIVLLQMGIKGAAIGTGIGYMIPSIIGTIFFLMKRSELHFCKPDMDASVLLKSCSNGVSELVSQCSTAVTTFLFNVTMMKLLGEDGVAAITVLIYSQFLLTTLYIGFSMGTAPVVSYNYGSGNVKQLKKTVRICFSFIPFGRIAGEILEMTPEAYRQRLSRIRKKMADFLGQYCGEYGSGRCKCKERVNYAIQNHRINPLQLDYTTATEISIQTMMDVKNAMEDIDDLSQDFSFCKPYQSPERTKYLIQEFLESTQLSIIQNS